MPSVKFKNITAVNQAFRSVSAEHRFDSKSWVALPGETITVPEGVDADCLRKIPAFKEVR